MNTEGRVIHVFELIAHRKIEIALSPGNDEAAISLVKAQLILEPRLQRLEVEVGSIHKRHGISDSRINALRNAESVTSFVIGILAGLDLAGRPDIVGTFAKLYAQSAASSVDSLFNNNGSRNGHRLN